MSLLRYLRQRFCRHVFKQYYGDLRATEPGGPRIFHETYWRCQRCGKLSLNGCAPWFVNQVRKFWSAA